jgi:hypothetical protein
MMNTTATARPDAWDLAYEAALAAIARTRAAGIYGNADVYAAVAACGITPAEADDIGALAVRAAFDTIAERRQIIAAIGEYL